jgi:capsular exopolysaccharide synthesis family protein
MADKDFDLSDISFAHYLDVIMRRRWIFLSAFSIVFISSIMYVFSTKPVYEAKALLVIEKERGGGNLNTAGPITESSNEDYYQTQYKLLKSDSLLRQVYNNLKLEQTSDFAQPRGVKRLSGAVIISPVVRSRLVYVKVESHDPGLAAKVANAVAHTFIEQNLTNQLFISKDVLQALQIQSGEISSDKTYASLPAVVNNPLIQQLNVDYAKLQSQFADMQAKYMPKHPLMIALRANIGALERQIRETTEKIVQSLKTELSGQLKGNNVRIVDPAELPEFPIRPKKFSSLCLGILLGGLVGLGAAFFAEVIDQSIRTQDDVERNLRLPFLGSVPLIQSMKGAPYQPLLDADLSLSSEAIRNVRTMIDFAGVSGKAKAFLVTSSVQDEGKSYIASNLAVAFYQRGESVLLINGDLRRPTLARIFGVSKERGLSDFLANGESVEEITGLLQDPRIPNLKMLPCGPRPPNPSELLNTPRVGALVEWAKASFDRVIIDCTPMFPIHDTLLWGRFVSSAVFVVRYGRTRPPLAQKARQRLDEGGVKVLGVVVNAAKAGGLTYASYGPYYQQYYQAYRQEASAA